MPDTHFFPFHTHRQNYFNHYNASLISLLLMSNIGHGKI